MTMTSIVAPIVGAVVAASILSVSVRADIVPFTDEALARGVNYTPIYASPFGTGTSGKGIAFADLDGDGDADLVCIGASSGVIGVYENDGTGHFIDRAATSGLPIVPATRASGITAADYDGDGDLDLFVMTWLVPNRLFRNNGGLHFTDVTVTSGLGDVGLATGAAWADYDGDGWLDLAVGNLKLQPNSPPNRFYRNLGDGSFEEVGARLGVADFASTWQVVFIDFDRDDDMDYYVSNDKGNIDCIIHNHLYENVGGVFVDVTERSGTEACADSMGVAVGDFDGNGDFDLYCTNIPAGNPLLMNQGNGSFLESTLIAGTASYATGWGATFADFDNDGNLDLFVCNADAPNRLYWHSGQWPCNDAAPAAGVADPGLSYCLATADIDQDGDMDFCVQNDNQPLRLYINHSADGAHWLRLRIRGTGPNRHAVGARAEVQTGTTRRISHVAAGSNFKSQNDLTLHFGLGDATSIDEIRVHWPGGQTRRLAGYATDRTWVVRPTEQLGDADDDGDLDMWDYVAFVSCVGTPFEPPCAVMDFDGNGAVTQADFSEFLARFGDLADCDGNGIVDVAELFNDPAADMNGNAILDACERDLGDLTGDGVVDSSDIAVLLAEWGACQCPSDFTHDGIVDMRDLIIMLANYGN